MAFKQYFFQVSSLFFLILITLSLLKIYIIPITAFDFKHEIKEDFHFDSSHLAIEKLFLQSCGNDAFFNIWFHLFANSTNNITLLIEPDNWNVTHIPVAVGQTINVTVTNGEVIEPYPNDLPTGLKLLLQRENVSDEVWGHFIFGIITFGWDTAPWPVIPGVFALVLLWAIRRRKKQQVKDS